MGTDPKTRFRQVFPLLFNFPVFNEFRTKFPYNVGSGKLYTWGSWYGFAYVGLLGAKYSVELPSVDDYVAESVCERRR